MVAASRAWSDAVTARSGLTVTKTAPTAVDTLTDPTASAEVVTYTIIVTNTGPSSSDQLRFPDTIKQARFNLYMVFHDGSSPRHQANRSVIRRMAGCTG